MNEPHPHAPSPGAADLSPQQALAQLEALLQRDPTNIAAWLAAGEILEQFGEFPQAIAVYRRVLALDARQPAASYRLAQALLAVRAMDAAEQVVEQFAREYPQSPDAWTLLAALRQKQLRDPEAAAALRHALQRRPNPACHSNLLQILQYDDTVSPELLRSAHQAWNALYAAPLASQAPPPCRSTKSASPLRIGLVSADFGRHPVGFLALRPLECLDKHRSALVCYYDRLPEDEYTHRFRAAADAWRVTAGWSDERLAAQVREDQIDVLIDLMGHTGHRLLVFARKPAPAQLTWLGYVGTTGLAAMDYLLADRHHVRPGEEHHYVERIARLPHGYACYSPPPDCPPVAPLPAQSAGRVMFGSFNTAAKLSPRTIDRWSEILRRVPDSQLLLKNRSFDQPRLRDRFFAEFAQRGIPPQRLVLEGGASHRDLLATYSRVDLALDTQPYSGGLTTCEALWMGVPVITFPGATFAGRHSTSHLITAGLAPFVAADAAGYVELAVAWASRLGELAAVRFTMRERISRSPLCDAPAFAAALVDLLQRISARG